MGIFSFLGKDKIENENKSKPFYENKSNSERKDWFSRTRPWNKVNPQIIDALIAKYNDDPMFEVFVITSMKNGLVKKYEDIGLSDVDSDVACSIISGILSKLGGQESIQVDKIFNSGNINEKELSKVYANAMNLHESAIIIEPNQVYSYVNLAALKSRVNKDDEALSYVKLGLKAIERSRAYGDPSHESDIPSIRNATKDMDEIERTLLLMENELS